MIITSRENPKIKRVMDLRKSSKRKKEGQIVIEGKKEIEMALSSGVEIAELFFCRDFGNVNDIKIETTELSKELFQKISLKENPDGFIALAKAPKHRIEDLNLSEKPLLLILEKVEKPGNIGAALRTADAVGVDAVILCDEQTDFYNPNVIRASLGAVFSVPTFSGSNEEVLKYLKAKKIKVYSACISNSSQDFRKVDLSGASAVVIGTEHDGLSEFWVKNADQNIILPMKGKIDSLNASVSAAVILYEAERQRNKRKN